jgi:hypothetical protein
MRVKAERIEELVHELDTIADPRVQSVARELVQSVTALHANGLERILEVLSESGAGCAQVIEQLGEDGLVGPLMALHGLHPLELPDRVARAVERFGEEAQLLGIADGNVRVRLRTQAHGCGSTGNAQRVALEDAIYDAAPDLTSLSIEEESISQAGFVPLVVLSLGSAR